jgi:hypothetical protein
MKYALLAFALSCGLLAAAPAPLPKRTGDRLPNLTGRWELQFNGATYDVWLEDHTIRTAEQIRYGGTYTCRSRRTEATWQGVWFWTKWDGIIHVGEKPLGAPGSYDSFPARPDGKPLVVNRTDGRKWYGEDWRWDYPAVNVTLTKVSDTWD